MGYQSNPGLSLKTYASLIYDTSFQKDWGKTYNLYTLNRQTGNYDVFVPLLKVPLVKPFLKKAQAIAINTCCKSLLNYEQTFGEP